MIKISEALKEIIGENATLRTGMYYDLMNLTRLAHFIKPLLEAKTKKPITESAILMALSRISGEKRLAQKNIPIYRLKNITIRASLSSITYIQHPDIHIALDMIYGTIVADSGYITINQ